jgi:hypothetical protein
MEYTMSVQPIDLEPHFQNPPPFQHAQGWVDASDTPTETINYETAFQPHHGGEAGRLVVRDLHAQMNSPSGVQSVMDAIRNRKDQLENTFQGVSRQEIRPLVQKMTEEANKKLDVVDGEVKDFLLKKAAEREVLKEEIAWLRRQWELGMSQGPWNGNR